MRREESDGTIFGVDLLCQSDWVITSFSRESCGSRRNLLLIHPFTHSFIPSFLLTSYCVLGFVLAIVDIMVRKTDKVSALMGLTTDLGKNQNFKIH